jgi:hypothetical protein
LPPGAKAVAALLAEQTAETEGGTEAKAKRSRKGRYGECVVVVHLEEQEMLVQ